MTKFHKWNLEEQQNKENREYLKFALEHLRETLNTPDFIRFKLENDLTTNK